MTSHYRSPRSRITSKSNAVVYEQSPRWIRGFHKETKIVDSKRAYLVWEGTSLIPFWAFPTSDVIGLVESDTVNGGRDGDRGQWFHVKTEAETLNNAAWRFKKETPGFVPEAEDLVVFDFTKLSKWLEDDEVAFGHPRSPYSRIDVRLSSRHVKVEIDGVVVAETTSALFVYENGHPTRYYINAVDVKALPQFTPSDYKSACPYKGVASYFTATINGQEYPNIAWTYLDPVPGIERIQGRWSFWNEKLDITVDGEKLPRPAPYIVHTSP
ncbi:hypothetical protein K450DRAFT_200821 [Umbelopsis ramanniana AG]|uniref:DUF427 domain-containing protein n=1 Tax=Umbelopsis ramanniana AG TaxID=1314678 RepID=A0AAD5E736_UMBRA|nr:uncharacterized protein K450DRAFT_200821 [Umbelopsis ramanniana AG]KAI8577924.1 hypothetical protein K450DRAFT_200821 [Umbelopsis ramanniana AG]